VSWSGLRGHEAVVEQFTRAVGRGRLAHAYLFIGPPGIGKRLFAVELAKALLCEDSRGKLQACDRCPACIQVEAGTHPDFRASGRPADVQEFPVELMRELCQGFSLKSARGRGKVVVIDDADDLNDESANCFLKTLEEPPPGSVLILIGTGTDRQKATITSRCQVVRFRPLSPDIVDELLNKQGVDDDALRARLVRLSGGSPGQALALAEPELWDFRRTLVEGLASPRFDPVALAKAWIEFTQEAGKEAMLHRRRARLTLRLLIDFLSDVLAARLERGGRLTEESERSMVQALAERIDTDGLTQMVDRCLEADFQLERNVQTPLVLEALCDAFANGTTTGPAPILGA
jgi:DNA polymerase-3 subunit delta'